MFAKSLSFLCCTFVLVGSIGSSAAETYSGQAAKESGQTSAHGSASAANSIAATGQLTSAAVAVPLSVGGAVLGSTGAVLGSVGAAGTSAANQSMRAATAPIGTPLDVTDEVITVTPPNKALQTNTSVKKETNL